LKVVESDFYTDFLINSANFLINRTDFSAADPLNFNNFLKNRPYENMFGRLYSILRCLLDFVCIRRITHVGCRLHHHNQAEERSSFPTFPFGQAPKAFLHRLSQIRISFQSTIHGQPCMNWTWLVADQPTNNVLTVDKINANMTGRLRKTKKKPSKMIGPRI
jgi:hypothetical protein